jgi:hypothetical protein
MVSALAPEVQHLLGDFRVTNWTPGVVPVSGTIWPYEQMHVMRHLSQTARRVRESGLACGAGAVRDEERFWLVDDRWGITEINLLKGQWRSWVLPAPRIDAVRVAQMAVLWPMGAACSAPRGLYLVPAASVSFADRSFLLLCPFGMEPELSTLIRGGYRVIGQSWTAIKEYEGRFSLMNFPGYVQRAVPPGMRLSGSPTALPTWIDLMHEFYGAEQRAGWCDAVLVARDRRRLQAASARSTAATPCRSCAAPGRSSSCTPTAATANSPRASRRRSRAIS